ncbi:glycosyltransferase family 2 protein [Virgibacillus sp. L01]|uniref:glycosyltransferase family 2 protein n=1 Tax=Virgibacillus sp. L01 TaxID=3457429 RepID=UPI003FCFD703
MSPKISIIVPIYKVEQYINKCIDSILAQTFTDFELILVNDGSPDICGEICDSYSEADSRIKVIHKGNGGLSDARNAGINVSEGEYIGFVDSDDYIHEKMYETMLNNALTYSSDVVICDFFDVNENESTNKLNLDEKYQLMHLTNLEALEQLYKSKPGIYVYAWNKLYKKHLFNNIRFDKGRIYEDEFITHKILFKSNLITYISCCLYYYVKRTDSILNSPFTIKRFDKVYALKERAEYFKNKKQPYLFYLTSKKYLEVFFWNYFAAKSSLTNVKKDLRVLKRTLYFSLIDLIRNPLLGWKSKVALIIFVVNPFIFELFKDFKNR